MGIMAINNISGARRREISGPFRAKDNGNLMQIIWINNISGAKRREFVRPF